MADVIVLMDKGQIQQEGTPEQVYHDPNSVFIAQFIGSPAMNVLKFDDGAQFGFRPEKVVLSKEPGNAAFQRRGEILTREMLGSETLYKVQLGDVAVMVKSLSDTQAMGDTVYVGVAREHLYFFGAGGARIRGAAECEPLLAKLGGLRDDKR